jgi:hypothetical protein
MIFFKSSLNVIKQLIQKIQIEKHQCGYQRCVAGAVAFFLEPWAKCYAAPMA